jgi:hypothetical protein
VAAPGESDGAVLSPAACEPRPVHGGLIDLHTDGIALSLLDLASIAPWEHWPSVEQTTETGAHILVGGHGRLSGARGRGLRHRPDRQCERRKQHGLRPRPVHAVTMSETEGAAT